MDVEHFQKKNTPAPTAGAEGVDLTVDESLSAEQKRARLFEIRDELVSKTGKESGRAPAQTGPNGQPQWGFWWGDDKDTSDK